MTDARKNPGDEALTAFPGLQLLGAETAMGACVDGVCAMPGTSPSDPTAQKSDSAD